MEGPNLKWGEPVGTYEIEIIPSGALFIYRSHQKNGGLLQFVIPMTTQDLAEMQAMLNVLRFNTDITTEIKSGLPELPDGIVIH